MRQVNLRSVDLNLLVILQALLDTRHVSKAAESLDMSQPAVSRAFQRLRQTFSDPLLVRTSSGYELTQRAADIQPQLTSLLQDVQQLVAAPIFNPATATDCLRVTGLDMEVSLYLPQLTQLLHAQAPFMNMEILRQRDDPFERLDNGESHFLLSGAEPKEGTDQIHRLLLDSMHSVCVMNSRHPLAQKAITPESYAEALHGMVTITGTGHARMDEQLKKQGLQRRVMLRLVSFMSVGDFCEETELVFTLPRRLAEKITKGRHSLVMRELPKPLQAPEIKFYLYWHNRFHHAPMCQWIRKILPETLTPLPPH